MPCHLQVSTLEVDIAKVRSDLIAKDDELRELAQQASSDDKEASAEASAEAKKVKVEKNVLQAQLECKSRQLKVSICCFPTAFFHPGTCIQLYTPYHIRLLWGLSSEFVLDESIVIMLCHAMLICSLLHACGHLT